MTPGRHVMIAGAGIAGLTAALALARAGLRVSVFEQAEKLKETGAGIQLAPNATRILIALGLGERLKAVAFFPRAIRVMAGGAANEIVRIPLGKHAENRYGAPYWTVHRGDLQKVLAQAAGEHPDIALRLGTRIEDFALYGGGVTVQGRRGADVVDERGIALIGADGVWSTMRARVRRQRPPRFRNRTAWRALVPANALSKIWQEPVVNLWLGIDAHLVHYPVKDGSLVNIVAVVQDHWRSEGWDTAGNRAEILRHFQRWSWAEPARRLIAVPAQWQKWALYDRSASQRGGSGPVTLIGDAAHPMLPFLAQGAGMAIEDAAVLAYALKQNLADPPAGLRAYERARRRRTAAAQRASRRQGRIYGLTGPEALVRNLGMRMLGGEKLLARQDWLYSWKPPARFRDA